jgi:hypothetical protein
LNGLEAPAWTSREGIHAERGATPVVYKQPGVQRRRPVPGCEALWKVRVRRGTWVREGQLLVTIESSVESSAAETARCRAGAQGGLDVARSKVAAANDKARRIEALHAEALVAAQACDDVAAAWRLPLRLFKQVKPGQRISVTPEVPFDWPMQATVRTVDRVVDATAGTLGIPDVCAQPRRMSAASLEAVHTMKASTSGRSHDRTRVPSDPGLRDQRSDPMFLALAAASSGLRPASDWSAPRPSGRSLTRGDGRPRRGSAGTDSKRILGGVDGARTRDPRRDRPVF